MADSTAAKGPGREQEDGLDHSGTADCSPPPGLEGQAGVRSGRTQDRQGRAERNSSAGQGS